MPSARMPLSTCPKDWVKVGTDPSTLGKSCSCHNTPGLNGATKFQRGRGNDNYNAQIKFQEITPILYYQHTKQMRITMFYMFLNTKSDKEIFLKKKDTSVYMPICKVVKRTIFSCST